MFLLKTKEGEGLLRWLSGKESTCQHRRCGFNSWAWKIPWRRKWQPTLASLPGKSHGHRSLVGYSSWGRKESGTTEPLMLTYHVNSISLLSTYQTTYFHTGLFQSTYSIFLNTLIVFSFFKLKYNCYTVLDKLQVYNIVNLNF